MQINVTSPAVGVMTIAAGCFAFRYRVARRQVELRPHRCVATQAGFLCADGMQRGILHLMRLVAVCAADIFLLVRAARPE